MVATKNIKFGEIWVQKFLTNCLSKLASNFTSSLFSKNIRVPLLSPPAPIKYLLLKEALVLQQPFHKAKRQIYVSLFVYYHLSKHKDQAEQVQG